MLLDRFKNDLRARKISDVFLKLSADPPVGYVVDSAGSTIDNDPFGVNCGKVDTDQEVPVRHREVDARRFQNSAADTVLNWVISEKGEMGRTAAGCDAVTDRIQKSANGLSCQCVQVRCSGRFQFRLILFPHRKAAEAVHDEKNDLRIIFDYQRIDKFRVHMVTSGWIGSASTSLP